MHACLFHYVVAIVSELVFVVVRVSASVRCTWCQWCDVHVAPVPSVRHGCVSSVV